MEKVRMIYKLFALVMLLVAIFTFTSCPVKYEPEDDDVDDDEVDDDTEPQPPQAPSNLTAEGNSEDIMLEWKDNSDNEDGFYVYRRPYGSGSFAKIAELEANATDYLDAGLGVDKDYEYKVTAFSDVGESEASNIARAQTAPNAPTELGATGSGTNINLSWTDNSQVESGFYIYRRAYGGGGFTKIATINTPNTTGYQDNAGVEKDYEYKVTAYNSAGESNDSNISRAQTVPNAPTNLSAVGGGTTVNLSWTDNSSIESGFNIYYRFYGSGSFSLLTTVAQNTTNYVHNAGAEKHFEYKVCAYNGAGESGYSNVDDAVTVPYSPTDLSVSEVKKYQATLEWTDNSGLEAGYKVERQLGTKAWQQIADLPANTEEYTDTGLECDGKNYQYRVKAYNSAGDSGYSNTDDATTLACWTIMTVDSTEDVGRSSSIALDSNDNVHISYYYHGTPGAYLKYATNSSNGWQTFIIDTVGDMGESSSIAIDKNDKVHISYYACTTNCNLKYATNASKGWQTFTVDSTGWVGEYNSIALDSNNKVHISYHHEGSDVLRYATNRPGNWETFTVDPTLDTGEQSSIAIDSGNKVHISHHQEASGDLIYTTNSSGTWQSFTLDSAGVVGLYTSIALDSLDKVHISYLDYTNADLKYATNSGKAWSIQTLDSTGEVGNYTSIALDSDDKVHISYYAGYPDYYDLKYATNASGSWQYFTVDSAGDVGYYTSIAIDSNDKVHISYMDWTNKDLKYATNAEVE